MARLSQAHETRRSVLVESHMNRHGPQSGEFEVIR
jgi:hypothetical protein